MTKRSFAGDGPFPLVALIDDGSEVALYAVSCHPPHKLAVASFGSSLPHGVAGHLTTVINYDAGVYGLCRSWDDSSCRLESRAIDPSVGFAFDPHDERHSRLLETQVLRSVPRQEFARLLNELMESSRDRARRLADSHLEAELYLDGFSGMPEKELLGLLE